MSSVQPQTGGYNVTEWLPVYDKGLSEDEGECRGWEERTGGAPNRETPIFFLFKRINMWYHDPFHYFLSINVRFGQFTFGPVKFSHVVAQMACKFQIPKSLTVIN
jgi:hypothetical protein